ncbi:plasmid recombination protein, partial [Salmonella enterica]|uniref:plasmid recombination protein n=1 Tax=Salmonella enterica TaxID=28901 RepID=UPI000CBCE3C6
IQDDFPRFMNEQGFSLQRGEKDSQRKNLSVPEYKTMKEDLKILKTDKEQTQEEVNQLSTEVHDLEKDYQKYLAVMDTVQDIDVKSE